MITDLLMRVNGFLIRPMEEGIQKCSSALWYISVQLKTGHEKIKRCLECIITNLRLTCRSERLRADRILLKLVRD